MAWHGYFAVENLALNDEQIAAYLAILSTLGANDADQPAHRNHQWSRDSQTMFEALFTDTEISIASQVGYLEAVMGVSVDATWDNTVTITFSYDGTDYIRIVYYGGISCGWNVSRLSALFALYPATIPTLIVENLNDDGQGSLRSAITQNDVVVFGDVHGTIELASPIYITRPATVLGETASGAGVAIKNYPIITRHADITLRYLRLRPGPLFGDGNTDALRAEIGTNNLIVENCSLSWSVDELVEIFESINNIVFRNCIFSEALYDSVHPDGVHSCGVLVGNGANNIAFIRCIFAHNSLRNPVVQCGRVDVINCVYLCTGGKHGEFWDGAATADHPTRVNLIGNYYNDPTYDGEGPVYLWSYHESPLVEIYAHDNYIAQYPEATQADLMLLPAAMVSAGHVIDDFVVDAMHERLTDDEILSAADAYTYVLANAGATLPARDTVDTRIINDVINGTGGLIDDPSEVGGWPDL